MATTGKFERHFIAQDFKPTDWKSIQPYAENLLNREWKSAADYQQWLNDWDEYNVVMAEESAWRYINQSVDTTSKEAEKSYNYWTKTVQTKDEKYNNALDKRFIASPYNDTIKEIGFEIALKQAQASIALFREENLNLKAQDTKKSAQHGKIMGGLSAIIDGKETTIEAAASLLEGPDRGKREEAWNQIVGTRYKQKNKIDTLFDGLVKTRHQIALNAGEKNYRDYKFKEYQRFDYTPQDCFTFHEAIEKAVVPLAKKLAKQHESEMNIGPLRPWDYGCDPKGRPAIVAFKGSEELVEKTLQVFDATVPAASKALRRMKDLKLLDLDARKGKGINGYNCSLPETKSSFMLTNQVGTVTDMTTMFHEGGHATHDYLVYDLPYTYQQYPIEIAEVASMSMELMTFDQWNVFIPDEEECNRAKYNHLKAIVDFMPYMAQVDAFQHEVYEKPDMTCEERHDVWQGLNKRFDTSEPDMTGINPDYARTAWQKKMHIFEIPFYYVEYGIAQLGALQMWRNYKENKEQAVANYQDMLSLGYTKSIPEVYKAGGIKFDFSVDMIGDLMGFVGEEMEKLIPKKTAPQPT